MTIEMENEQIRRQFDIAYSELRLQFIKISKPHLTAIELNLLKIKYSDVIKSARTSDYINSIEGLLRTLEKRGALSYDNIEILKYISDTYVRDTVLERSLSIYEGQSRPLLPRCNRYLMQGKCTKIQLAKAKSITPNRHIIIDLNITENDNELENPRVTATKQNLSEDLMIPETETFIQNSVLNSCMEQKNIGNVHNLFVKVHYNICNKYGMGVIGTLLGVTLLILLTSMSNILCVESPAASAPRLEASSSTSGFQTVYNNASQSHRLPIQMTLYTTQPAFQVTLPGSIEIGAASQNIANNESEVTRRVFQEISEKIGRHWRTVARNLQVREHDIDEIENQLNLSLNEKALKALLLFQSKCDPLQWKSKLKRALDKARRRDLMELVDDLSSRKY